MVRAAELAAVVIALVLVLSAGGYGIERGVQTSDLDQRVAACQRHLLNWQWRRKTMGGNNRDAFVTLQTKDDEIQDYWGGYTFGGRECPCPVFNELVRRTAFGGWLPHIGCKKPPFR